MQSTSIKLRDFGPWDGDFDSFDDDDDTVVLITFGRTAAACGARGTKGRGYERFHRRQPSE